MKRAVIRSLLLLPSPPGAAGCFSPTSKYKQNMLLILIIFLLETLSIDVGICGAEINNTVISRREILEQQARTAYKNACYRMQELSNWMTAAFRIKSVWASATVNEISARSEGSLTESDGKNKSVLPPRFKTTGSECSFSSVQVTAQTYAYLQSQIVMMKWLMGRNIFKSSKERLEGANTSLRERMKMLDTFSTTLNDVVYNLQQNTANTSTPVDSEAWKARSIRKGSRESSFLQLLKSPKTLLMSYLDNQVMHNPTRDPNKSSSFFQNLGRNLDKLIFSVSSINTRGEHSESTIDATTESATDATTTTESTTIVSTTNVPKADVIMLPSIL